MLHFPWLISSVIAPLIGAAWIRRQEDPAAARRTALIVASVVLLLTMGAWLDFRILALPRAPDPLDPAAWLNGRPNFVVTELSSVLLPYAALLFALVLIAAPRVKLKQFSLSRTLFSESIVLATFSSGEPWVVVLLLMAGMAVVWYELRVRTPAGSRPALRVFSLYMAASSFLLVMGWALMSTGGSWWAVLLFSAALFIRQGLVPLHSWLPELFESATFGTALVFATPLVSAHAAMVLVEPMASEGVLHALGIAAVLTALYAAGMALVQREARRFFCYLFMSHSALVFVGLGSTNPIALTGGLCLWLSSGLALTGFGLAIWWLEARRGPLSLVGLHGGYEHTPLLAACFLLTGLASVGFPGTLGFVGAELMIDGAVHAYPLVGMGVVVAASLNGIAVLKAYFALFTGRPHQFTMDLRMRVRERLAMLVLAALLLAGGLFPQALIASRHAAARSILGPTSGADTTATHAGGRGF